MLSVRPFCSLGPSPRLDADSPLIAGLYAGICALGAVFCICLYPETAGLSIEETREVFSEGFGIRKADKLRKEKLAALGDMRGMNA